MSTICRDNCSYKFYDPYISECQYYPARREVDSVAYNSLDGVNRGRIEVETATTFWILLIISTIVAILIGVFLFWFFYANKGQSLGQDCNCNSQCLSGLYCSGSNTCQPVSDNPERPRNMGQSCSESVECIYPLQCINQKCQ